MNSLRMCMLLITGLAATMAFGQKVNIGVFQNEADIDSVGRPGSASYSPDQKSYVVAGGGENMWFAHDAFHFLWNEMSGNISLAADIKWIGKDGNAHRKACLVIRQGLDADAVYADAALHGDGLTSLQYRDEKGGLTHELRSNMNGPTRIRIEKIGEYVSMSIAGGNEDIHPAGGAIRIKFRNPFLIGIGVCAHDNAALEKAIFSNVKITSFPSKASGEPMLESTLETIAIASTDRRAIYTTNDHIEAPNWSRDGKNFLFNSNGRIYTLPVTGGTPQTLNTSFAVKCNNDHGLSPDGKWLAISDQSKNDTSLIYILPAGGGEPRLMTECGPSYWHGWSPDGKTLAYCAARNGAYDIYTISIQGGEERQLTNSPGLDDGPDYSPDGQYIYFNSERTGRMQVWRMKPNGSSQEQVTNDEYNNWFPHPSPDGKWIVFLSYEKGVKGHPANKDVMIRLMPAGGGTIQVLAKLFGGQGTINVPSWSPDSANLAFVSYRLVNP